jgi:PAS domain S-box-containing protein
MKRPQRPLDEQQRRKALGAYGVLDTPPEARFNRITRLATALFDVPAAMINFIDEDRQWCKAQTGVGLKETERDLSFCAHTILSSEVMVVEDATEDVRFAGNPFVEASPHIRFYAGAPLQTPDGHHVGTLCILDTDPRRFSTDDKKRLEDLAATVVSELELRREVHERKQVQAALSESESKFRGLVEQTNDWIWETDAEGHFTYVSPQVEGMIGYPADEVLGKTTFDFMDEVEARRFADIIEPHLEAGTSFSGLEQALRHRDGHVVVLETSGSPKFDEDGTLIGFRGITRDITDRKRRERELVRARQEAEAARAEAEEMNRLKSAFLANMSHELRTPLTSIIGFADLLRQRVGNTLKSYADRIHASGRRLLDTLDDVLVMARLESGAAQLEPQSFDLAAAARDIIEDARPRADEKGLAFRTDLPKETVPVQLDHDAVTRVLSNLVSNAVKFTDEGEIRFGCWDRGDTVVAEVQDTGVGIEDEFRSALFDAFRQESSGMRRSHEGSGLGLAITRRLIDMMGGTIEVESEKDAGSTFRITLPKEIGRPAGADEEGRTTGSLADRVTPRVLLVEDNEDTQALFRDMLEDIGTVEAAGSPEAARRAAQAGSYDAVIVDVNLVDPSTDSLALLRQLQSAGLSDDVPAVACTACALPGDREKFLEAGFDGYLAQPFRRDELLATLNDVLSAPRGADEASEGPGDERALEAHGS